MTNRNLGKLLAFFIFLAVLLTGCLAPVAPVPTTIQSGNPGQVSLTDIPSAVPLPTPIATAFATGATGVSPLATLLPLPDALRTVTVLAPDGSTQFAAEYSCPRAQAARQVPVSTYKVTTTFPHDPRAYTQGLIFRDGFLYEGTGHKGYSSLRKVILETGQVIQQHELEPAYFGEGITELDGKIYQITWHEQTGFIYERDTFNLLGTFRYPTQGWGLTHDGQQLIMSDGTGYLHFLDGQTLAVEHSLPVFDERGPVTALNELEYVGGEIWANVYQSACIARIDPQSGQVLGWIDLSGLLEPADMPGALTPNGIAFDPGSKRIFVTGKYWPKLFEIELTGE